MANEAILINRDSDIHYFTVTSQAIPEGTLMVISDPRTVTLHSVVGSIPVGYSVSELTAADGGLSIGVRGRGVVDVIADQAITVGDNVTPGSVANSVRTVRVGSLSTEELNRVFGVAWETASNAEVINVLLRAF